MQIKLLLQVQAPASVTRLAAAAFKDSKKRTTGAGENPGFCCSFLLLKH